LKVYIILHTYFIRITTGKFTHSFAKFEVSTAVNFQVEFFWVVTLCSVVVGYQRFRGPCRLVLQGEVPEMEAA